MISVVIPSYNRRECILTLLSDIYSQEGAVFEVIVVDDCSDDNTADAVSQQFPQATLLINERNLGPCVTRNRGIRTAKGEWVVGFDSDVTLPDRRLLAKAVKAFSESPDITGLAFRLLKKDGKSEDLERWWHPLPNERFANQQFLTSYFSGTAYAFRKEALVAAGMYPEIFYMHYEEIELALRIIDQGGKILHCPDLVVLHHANEVSRRSEVNLYYKPRNQILLAMSCYPLWKGLAFVLPRIFYQFFLAAKGGHLNHFARAMGDALVKSRAVSRCPLKSDTFTIIQKLKMEGCDIKCES